MTKLFFPKFRGFLHGWILVVSLVGLTLVGCVIPQHRGVINEIPPALACRVTKFFPSQLYTLAEGDVLELLYLTNPGVTKGPYRLQVRDQIDVEFSFHPEMNRTVRVRPDGRISIPRREDVSVVGKTAGEVKAKLTKSYRDLLKDPEITVTVREFNAKLDEMQKALTTAPYGQARVITIGPDGNIQLPLIANMRAAGLTVPQLTRNVNRTYDRIMRDMRISIFLKEIVGNVIFVDGEVVRPGVYNTKGPATVQQAIAMAGGTKATAEPRSVLVVSKAPNGRFLSRLTNLTAMTSASDYMLRRNDMVYVPRSTIARANIWVQQNITRLLLFTGWSIGLETDLGRTTVR